MNDLAQSEGWYFHLGDPAVDALSGYRKAGVVGGWNLYRPVR